MSPDLLQFTNSKRCYTSLNVSAVSLQGAEVHGTRTEPVAAAAPPPPTAPTTSYRATAARSSCSGQPSVPRRPELRGGAWPALRAVGQAAWPASCLRG